MLYPDLLKKDIGKDMKPRSSLALAGQSGQINIYFQVQAEWGEERA